VPISANVSSSSERTLDTTTAADERVRQLATAGCSLRQIARQLGLSHEAVRQRLIRTYDSRMRDEVVEPVHSYH
jgi:DNA-binding NarL/FixJ family response regulator